MGWFQSWVKHDTFTAFLCLLQCLNQAGENFTSPNPPSTLPGGTGTFSSPRVNTTSAASILPRGAHHSAGSRVQPDPPLPLPLIHSFGRQNPSPLGTYLTEGKNRDEIAGCRSIPSIPVSISAVIHQPVVVAGDVAGGVLLDIAPCPVSENQAAELW